MSKQDVRTSVEQLQAAFEEFRSTEQQPKEVSPYGVARAQLLNALSDAVITIGDFVADHVD